MSNMLSFRKIAAGAAALSLAIALPFGASAHRAWMLPSSTVVSGDDVWVTVVAAISNDMLYFEHHAMPLDRIKAYAPEGSDVAIENEIEREACRERVGHYVKIPGGRA